MPSRRFLALLAVVVVAAAWVVWGRLASAAARQVSVSWTPTCQGTRLSTFEGAPAIDSRSRWRCRIDVRIDNAGGHDLHLRRVQADYLGSGTGAEVRGFASRDAGFVDLDHDTGKPVAGGARGLDGRWTLDETVPARSSRHLVLTLGRSGGPCSSAGHFFVDDWPDVAFTVLGRERHAASDQRLVIHTLGLGRPGCR